VALLGRWRDMQECLASNISTRAAPILLDLVPVLVPVEQRNSVIVSERH